MRQSCDHRSAELTMQRFAQRATSFLMWIISRFQMMSQFTSKSQIILAAQYMAVKEITRDPRSALNLKE
jgi:hypothetical protein